MGQIEKIIAGLEPPAVEGLTRAPFPPTTVIRKITGHANEATMRPYIAITDKTIIEAMSKFSSRKTL